MKKYLPVFLPLLILSSGCSDYFINIQRTENFKDTKKEIKKVVCISPDIIFFNDNDFEDIDYNKTIAFEPYFLKKVKKYGKVSKFDYVVMHPLADTELTTDFYNYLIPLKDDILQASIVRENPMNESNFRNHHEISRMVFVAPSKLAPQFSALSKIYGTPYFAWYGILSSNGRAIFINTIVDVETSQVIYHEVKSLDRKLNKRNLPPLIYDSFKMIK